MRVCARGNAVKPSIVFVTAKPRFLVRLTQPKSRMRTLLQ